ncbi:hypothetical protein [Methanobrevibacter sp.]|uniref:hypothetical protein n=1 Tax=Methanobrevibacter sp. TaxID=66852 RepID=UPI0025E07B71|nr:hypothetical protein [Methanobrevibacter sp.]MBQ2666377.1 hypothetical protein [Methanobrevibacter sp.]MBQ2666930.1 hypothetical protein [Methanobrevibacter sp.]
MIKRDYILIIILLVVIAGIMMAIIHMPHSDNNHAANGSAPNHEVLANDTIGSVEVIRNIGNPNGAKIAYVVGVHPLENETHRTLLKILPNLSNLNYCYDIYIINVTSDIGYYGDGSSDNSPGRQNGQNLALKYVYPQILNGNYKLAVDVHSNVGAYEYRTFVFSPVKESLASQYAQTVADNSQNISYYAPQSTTSGPYLTVPLNENGVPAFYFEEYSFAPQSEKDSHMMELIYAIDSLNFS